MAVTLDAPAQAGLLARGPVWRVDCDLCPARLYLVADGAELALRRAAVEFDWRVNVATTGALCGRWHEFEPVGSAA